MSVAFLFPGQGVQREGMLRALPPHPAIMATVAEAQALLAVNELDSAEALASTEGTQLALLVAGVASARALEAEGARPDFVAGMSVGAFGAAVMARAIDFASALRLVRARGALMAAAFPTGFGLAAILGLDEKSIVQLVDRVRSPTVPVYLANINAPDQMVIAGSDRGLESVLEAARKQGARRVHRLAVTVPSHCPLLNAVAAELARLAANVPMSPAVVPYLTNRRARAVTDAEEIRADLAGNLCVAVRWHDMMTGMFERGADIFVETAPGTTLSELAESSFPAGRSLACQSQDLSALARSISGRSPV